MLYIYTQKSLVHLIKRNVTYLRNFLFYLKLITTYEYIKKFIRSFLSFFPFFFLYSHFISTNTMHQNCFFYQQSVVIKIDQRKLRIGDIDIRIRQPVRNLLLWFIIMGDRQIGEQSGICHRFVPMRSGCGHNCFWREECNMWSRDTVSIVLITDLLHMYPIVLISLYKERKIIKYVLYV